MVVSGANATVAVERRRRFAGCVALGSLLAATVACSQGAAAGGPAAGEGGRGGAAPIAVSTATVVTKPMAVTVRVVGNVEPSSTVEVRSQVTGELLSVHFTEGQDVKAGDLLFTIDPRTFQSALERAQANLARDTAQAKNAKAQLMRSADLLARGLVSPAQHDLATTQAEALAAAVEADAAEVEAARVQLDHTKITAPMSGRTGALLVHPGALVRAADTTPMVVINQISPVSVSFAVPARLLPELRSDRARGALEVQAMPAGSTGEPAVGTVTFFDNAIDRATDTIRLKATFQNTDHRLWPGAFVDVALQRSVDPHAIVVPNAAVQASQDGQMVFVVKPDSTVEVRPVTIGWTEGDESVVTAGLSAGETVVTDGQLRLTPGATVTTRVDE